MARDPSVHGKDCARFLLEIDRGPSIAGSFQAKKENIYALRHRAVPPRRVAAFSYFGAATKPGLQSLRPRKPAPSSHVRGNAAGSSHAGNSATSSACLFILGRRCEISNTISEIASRSCPAEPYAAAFEGSMERGLRGAVYKESLGMHICFISAAHLTRSADRAVIQRIRAVASIDVTFQ